MGWRNLQHWLKGGIISCLVYIVSFIFVYLSYGLMPYNSFSNAFLGFFGLFYYFPTSLILNLLNVNLDHGRIFIFLYSLFQLIFYFIIGAIIGLAFSKTRREK